MNGGPLENKSTRGRVSRISSLLNEKKKKKGEEKGKKKKRKKREEKQRKREERKIEIESGKIYILNSE